MVEAGMARKYCRQYEGRHEEKDIQRLQEVSKWRERIKDTLGPPGPLRKEGLGS